MCQITEYASENTIIQRIAVINLSTGNHVRFNAHATINGSSRLVHFFTNQSRIVLLSIFSHNTYALAIQNHQSIKSITLIITNQS